MNFMPRVDKVLELTNLRFAFEVCSLRDMVELLSRVAGRSSLAAATDALPHVAKPVGRVVG